MTQFCYTLSVDGREQDLEAADYATEAEGIEHGRALLKAALQVGRPESAYVAVFEDEGADDEPLGAWDWSRDVPEIVWSPAE